MSNLVKDVITISTKEYWELKGSYKRILLLSMVVFAPLIFLMDSSNSVIPIQSIAIIMPFLISFCMSAQLSLYTVLDEKQSNTLEVLLSLDISRLSIVVGKTIIPTLLGFLLGMLYCLAMKVSTIYFLQDIIFNLNIQEVIVAIIICYAGSNVSLFTTLLFTDIKVAPTISLIIISAIGIGIYKLVCIIGFSYIYIAIILIILSLLMTALNVFILSNKVSLITKA